MARYLLELFMEEIPARMQERAADQLKESFEKKLAIENIVVDSLEAFVTPRRLGISVEGLPQRQADRVEEKRGPRVGAPEQALQGFLQSAGVTIDACETRETEGKGAFYFLSQKIPGKPIEDILQQIVSQTIQEFQWPKSMRWGSYAMTWVRPMRSILSLLEGEVLPVTVEDPHVTVGRSTHGHRFLAPESLIVKDFEDYKAQLLTKYVVVDRAERSKRIADQIKALCSARDLQVKEDPELLKEVSGLVEWPVVLVGKIDERFMTLPPEVLETTMRSHQKYFSVLKEDGKPAPYFFVVSNMETIDQGEQIIEGNERVLRARLSDAEFFWVQDQKHSLEAWSDDLGALIFHEKIGSVSDRVARVQSLVASCFVGEASHQVHAERAAALSKADLVTGLVGEFPELQGVMGGYYAAAAGEDALVAQAIRAHYSPMGPSDFVPSHPVSVAVSLADKIDTLVSFWSIGIQPTGSKDPYALRRSALGVIRLIFDNRLPISLQDLFSCAYDLLPENIEKQEKSATLSSLQDFFAGRLRVFLRGYDFDPTHIDAVVSEKWHGDIYKSYQVLQSLSELLNTKMGQDLMTAYKRAANIVDQAERKGDTFSGMVNDHLFALEEEKHLHQSLKAVTQDIEEYLQEEDTQYAKIMRRLADLRPAMDEFFDKVTVQAEDVKVRANRLNLLHLARTLIESVADFSKVTLSQ